MNITGRIRVVVVAFAAAMVSLVAYSSQMKEIKRWSDMPTVLQQEILCRMLEVTNVQDLAVMEMSAGCIETAPGAGDGIPACKVELSLLGFSSASRLTQPCNSELDTSNIVFIAQKPLATSATYDGIQMSMERNWYYDPLIPRPGAVVVGCFHSMRRDEVEPHANLFRKRYLFVGGDSYKAFIADVMRGHKHTVRCERVSFVRYEPLCLFNVRDEVATGDYVNLTPISISRRDASEMFYVLLGEEGYKSRVKPGWFAPAESLRTLETEIGKSLAHLKYNPEELEKLREKRSERSKILWDMR